LKPQQLDVYSMKPRVYLWQLEAAMNWVRHIF
jgi:hypothetical protein